MDIEDIIINYVGGSTSMSQADQAFDKEVLDLEYYGGSISELGADDLTHFENSENDTLDSDFETLNVEGGDFETLNVVEGGDFETLDTQANNLADVLQNLMF